MESDYKIGDFDMQLLMLTDTVIMKDREAWVDQGTLLGLVRDNKLIEWDNDIDLSCMVADRPKVSLSDAQQLLDKGFVVLTSRYGYTIKKLDAGRKYRKIDLTFIYNQNGHKRKSYSDYGHQNFFARVFEKTIKELLRLVQRSKKRSIRLMLWMFANGLSWFYRSYFMKTIDMECPEWQFEMEKKPLMDELETIMIYRQPKKYIEFKYGADWHVPKKDWDYTTEDGGVISNGG